jgi:hypothetical protein
MPEEKPCCPRCGSNALVVKLGNQFHCNQDGIDFGLDPSPISTRALKAREGAQGYPKRGNWTQISNPGSFTIFKP